MPPSPKLATLARLTKAREQAAMAQLARVAAERSAAEAHVAELKSRTYTPETADDCALVERWNVWRQEELARRNHRLASAEAAFRETARESGRLIAESAVMDDLAETARNREKAERARRQSYATFPAVRCR